LGGVYPTVRPQNMYKHFIVNHQTRTRMWYAVNVKEDPYYHPFEGFFMTT